MPETKEAQDRQVPAGSEEQSQGASGELRDQAGVIPDPVHQPDLTAQTGYVATTEFGGPTVKDVTPVFEATRLRNLEHAARALDPEDAEVPASHVVLPQGQRIVPVDPEAEAKRVREAAKAAEGAIKVLNETGAPPAPAPAGTAKDDAAKSANKTQQAAK